MPSYPPSTDDFKSFFDRDFIYGTGMDTVRDSDITKSFALAAIEFNSAIWDNVTEAPYAFLYLSAHYLSLSIQDAGGASALKLGKGVQTTGKQSIESKTVGSVSVNYAIPEKLKNSPMLNKYMRTAYGMEYLGMLAGRAVANVYTVSGTMFLPVNPIVPEF